MGGATPVKNRDRLKTKSAWQWTLKSERNTHFADVRENESVFAF